MKTRSGFVSNSRSSSYIIAIKSLFEKFPTCGRTGNNLLKMIERYNDRNDDNENEVDGVGAEHILCKMQNGDWYTPDPELLEKIKGYQGNEEWTLAEVSISYHNEMVKDELIRLVDEGNVVIVDGPNG